MKKSVNGITIVELLIVIVVIAILAAISIVAYNGIQERAKYSRLQSDLATINKIVLMYHADKGEYPSNNTGVLETYSATASTNFIPGLVPAYTRALPLVTSTGRGDYWAYIVNAAKSEYKLVRLASVPNTLPSIELSHPKIDPQRSDRGWGYWSAGGNTL